LGKGIAKRPLHSKFEEKFLPIIQKDIFFDNETLTCASRLDTERELNEGVVWAE